MPAKLDIETVRARLLEKGHTLLSDKYVNAITKLQYNCGLCGDVGLQCFSKLMQNMGHGCQGTGLEKINNNNKNGKRKLNIETVRARLLEKGHILLSDKYVNAREKLEYKCGWCGNIGIQRYFNLIIGKGHGCRGTGVEIINNNRKKIKEKRMTLKIECIKDKLMKEPAIKFLKIKNKIDKNKDKKYIISTTNNEFDIFSCNKCNFTCAVPQFILDNCKHECNLKNKKSKRSLSEWQIENREFKRKLRL